MAAPDPNLLIVYLFKLATLLVGLAFAWMGYRLFIKGFVEMAADLEASAGKRFTIKLTRAAPGVFFALFGAAIVVYSVTRIVQYQSNPPGGQREQVISMGAPVAPTADSEPVDSQIGTRAASGRASVGTGAEPRKSSDEARGAVKTAEQTPETPHEESSKSLCDTCPPTPGPMQLEGDAASNRATLPRIPSHHATVDDGAPGPGATKVTGSTVEGGSTVVEPDRPSSGVSPGLQSASAPSPAMPGKGPPSRGSSSKQGSFPAAGGRTGGGTSGREAGPGNVTAISDTAPVAPPRPVRPAGPSTAISDTAPIGGGRSRTVIGTTTFISDTAEGDSRSTGGSSSRKGAAKLGSRGAPPDLAQPLPPKRATGAQILVSPYPLAVQHAIAKPGMPSKLPPAGLRATVRQKGSRRSPQKPGRDSTTAQPR